MGTRLDHRRCAEECVAMARLADGERDRMLWLTLAQSWMRLAEHVAHFEDDAAERTATAIDAPAGANSSHEADGPQAA